MIILKRASTEKLTAALALPATGQEQDWEIELADPTRIGDFLTTYQNSSLTPDDKVALMALILASVDLHIGAGAGVPLEWERIATSLAQERELHQETLRYWACEGDDDPDACFHVTPLIRTINPTFRTSRR